MSDDDWMTIDSAPTDGRPIAVCQIRDGGEVVFHNEAAWRTVTFPSFINGIYGVEPAYTDTGWMHPSDNKRVPGPTHWRPVK